MAPRARRALTVRRPALPAGRPPAAGPAGGEATGGSQRLVRLAINDSTCNVVAPAEVAPKATSGTAISTAGPVKLARGDKISAVVAQDSGAGLDVNGGTTILAMCWAGPAS